MTRFYVYRGDAVDGPYTSAELKQMATEGTLGLGDQVCREGTETWVAAWKVKGLFEDTSASSGSASDDQLANLDDDDVPVATPVIPPSPSKVGTSRTAAPRASGTSATRQQAQDESPTDYDDDVEPYDDDEPEPYDDEDDEVDDEPPARLSRGRTAEPPRRSRGRKTNSRGGMAIFAAILGAGALVLLGVGIVGSVKNLQAGRLPEFAATIQTIERGVIRKGEAKTEVPAVRISYKFAQQPRVYQYTTDDQVAVLLEKYKPGMDVMVAEAGTSPSRYYFPGERRAGTSDDALIMLVAGVALGIGAAMVFTVSR